MGQINQNLAFLGQSKGHNLICTEEKYSLKWKFLEFYKGISIVETLYHLPQHGN